MAESRRDFLKKGALASGGLLLGGLWKSAPAFGKGAGEARKIPAVLGGAQAHPASWPKWPKWKGPAWDEKLIAVGDTPSEILSNGEEVAYSVRYILGDADNNGIIEAVDTALIQRKLADIETEYYDEVLQQGDADGNGELDLPDVTAIQYYLAKMKTPYLIGADVV